MFSVIFTSPSTQNWHFSILSNSADIQLPEDDRPHAKQKNKQKSIKAQTFRRIGVVKDKTKGILKTDKWTKIKKYKLHGVPIYEMVTRNDLEMANIRIHQGRMSNENAKMRWNWPGRLATSKLLWLHLEVSLSLHYSTLLKIYHEMVWWVMRRCVILEGGVSYPRCVP